MILRRLLLIVLVLYALPALPAIIQRSITIDAALPGGGTSDWKTPTDISSNPGQFSTDAEGDKKTGSADDLDYTIDNTGRDLKKFAYTYDSAFLYLWVERYASTQNTTDWWFFLDSGGGTPDGLMQTNEPLLRVSWKGNNGTTTVRLYNYISARAGGDPMTCPASGANSVADGWCPVAGVADGYDMPGTTGARITLLAANGDIQNQNGGMISGPAAGVEMETKISWAALGYAAPSSLGFHIAASNGQNIPASTEDNMDGPGGNGGSLLFADLAVRKSASTATAYSGSNFSYTVSLTNNGGSDASGLTLSDILPAGVSYLSDNASHGSYNPVNGLWTVGTLANQAIASLTLSVSADTVSVATVVTNTANNLALEQADPVSGNDSDSVDVTIIPAPDILTLKSVQTLSDPVNGSTSPKAIPGAVVQYTITSSNSGFGTTDTGSITVTDSIPANTEMYVGDIAAAGSGPLAFIDGSTSSTLGYTFAALGNGTDDIEFSDDGGVTYNYTPLPDADGYDSNITHFRGLTSGAFAASDGINDPGFSFQFRVRVK